MRQYRRPPRPNRKELYKGFYLVRNEAGQGIAVYSVLGDLLFEAADIGDAQEKIDLLAKRARC
jgi:hypothetical protein